MALVGHLSLKGEAMLRLVLLVFYLASLYSSGQTKIGGGLDPNGLNAPTSSPTADGGGGCDPDGLKLNMPPSIPTTDGGGGLDPNG
jgi:hypothetical protein